MSIHLLAISIGPVQEFIAAARRTRDLWFGSHLLSELSRAAAQAVKENGELIFPTQDNAADKDAAIANIVLAKLSAGGVPRDVADSARKAVQKKWEEYAEKAREQAATAIRDDIWKSQLNDAIEFYAAWTPMNGAYKTERARVMRLLAGRKACRNFTPAQGRQGVPKSSLDGRRESVLLRDAVCSSLRLAEGEQLCAIGLTKRLAGGTTPYPSVARIAADPWLRGIEVCATEKDPKIREGLGELQKTCQKLRDAGHLNGLSENRFPQFASFPYEGTCVYPSRFHEWRRETGLVNADLDPLCDAMRKLKDLGFGEADPYLAVLVADGDRIGATLSALESTDEHRKFSAALAEFSKQVNGLVAENRGVCVFAGGDDVLAFVPVDKCLECARKLRDTFEKALRAFKNNHGCTPTLSVGIAIGHFMEPLEDLRDYGTQAEKAAKAATPDTDKDGVFSERNGLAVVVHPRGGSEFGVREHWQAGESSLHKRLALWAGLFSERKLPNKLPYDFRLLAQSLSRWPDPGAPPEAVQAEARLLLGRKEAKKECRAKVEARLEKCSTAADLLRLAEEMLVAQWIASAQRQAGTRDEKASQEDTR